MAPMGLSKLVRVQEEARYALSVSLAKFDGRFADHKSWIRRLRRQRTRKYPILYPLT